MASVTYDRALALLIAHAVARLRREMWRKTPLMAQAVWPWVEGLSATARPEDYLTHPLAFPMLLLPWWVERTIREEPDMSFQADVAYSTINGYFAIRMIDNLMDGHATVETRLLPALSSLLFHFQGTYQAYFPAIHPFWSLFAEVWEHTADLTMADAATIEMDEAGFVRVAAQKTGAAKIPVAATCYRHNRSDLIEPWSRVVDALGCWHQMLNDLFDWPRDQIRGIRSYFLSEADRRHLPNEPIFAWVAREGFAWGVQRSHAWMAKVREEASHVGSSGLLAYLHEREALLAQQEESLREGLSSLAQTWQRLQRSTKTVWQRRDQRRTP